jgi:hypothetical protein
MYRGIYLTGTVSYGLTYGHRDRLECYVDASYAPEGKRCTTGWVVCMHGGPVAWDSQLQDLVTLTLRSCEADLLLPRKYTEINTVRMP